MIKPDEKLLKGHYLIHHRYNQEEYLIDERTYQYLIEYVSRLHYSLHMVPENEWIHCKKLIGKSKTLHSEIPINSIVFEMPS